MNMKRHGAAKTTTIEELQVSIGASHKDGDVEGAIQMEGKLRGRWPNGEGAAPAANKPSCCSRSFQEINNAGYKQNIKLQERKKFMGGEEEEEDRIRNSVEKFSKE